MGTIVFISPHYDDVVLSCPFLLQKLVQGKEDVLVVTLFCEDQPEREKENESALSHLGARSLSLGLKDAPQREYVRQRGGRILFATPSEDMETSNLVKKRLQELDHRLDIKRVYAPLGVGWHIDHLIAEEAASSVFKDRAFFYEDSPYKWVHSQTLLRLGETSSQIIDDFKVDFLKAFYIRSFLPHWTENDFMPLLENQLKERIEPKIKAFTVSPTSENVIKAVAAIECYVSQISFLYGGREELMSKISGQLENYFQNT